MPLPPALIARFTNHLTEVLDEVTALEAEIAAGREGREPLRALAHKLAGTAGGYGFPTVGERARLVERTILADAGWDAGLAERVEELRQALADVAR